MSSEIQLMEWHLSMRCAVLARAIAVKHGWWTLWLSMYNKGSEFSIFGAQTVQAHLKIKYPRKDVAVDLCKAISLALLEKDSGLLGQISCRAQSERVARFEPAKFELCCHSPFQLEPLLCHQTQMQQQTMELLTSTSTTTQSSNSLWACVTCECATAWTVLCLTISAGIIVILSKNPTAGDNVQKQTN